MTEINPDAAQRELLERIADARESSKPLCIVGGGTKSFYGRENIGEPITTSAYQGIVDYEPSELVITARAGTPLHVVEETLAAQGQELDFEPPRFGPASTIGGVVAAGLSGPRRPYVGALRDRMLGIEICSSEGEVLRFGGQVMKNVAGYDVTRLMSGALGTLGLILSVSIRVAPKAAAEITLAWQLGRELACEKMNAMAQKPWPISAMAYEAGVLRVRMSGHEEGVRFAEASLAPDESEDLTYWSALRDLRSAFFQTEETLWRLSLPSAAVLENLPGNELLDWGGAQRWLKSDAKPSEIQNLAQSVGGYATCLSAESDAPFAPLDPVSLELHKRLKNSFDPHGIFNPGRYYADF